MTWFDDLNAKKNDPNTAAPKVEAPVKVLKLGDTGPEVKAMQELLGIAADGDFGPQTKQALVAFQAAHQLAADGVYGPATAAVLTAKTPAPTPTPAGTPAPAEKILGVDISRYQHAMVWKALIDGGYKFAIIKRVDGRTKDADGDGFVKVARTLGITVGHYCFWRFDIEPIEQAKAYLAAVGTLPSGEMICMDVEPDNLSSNPQYRDMAHGGEMKMDAAGYQHVLKGAKYIAQESGAPLGIYTGDYFWTCDDPAPNEFANYWLWLSGYVSNVAKLHVPAPWSHISIWQNSGDLKIPGSNVSGIDGDVCLVDIKGLCKA